VEKGKGALTRLGVDFILVLYSTMRKIINEIWGLEKFDAVKLAKYTRCLFQATLPLDDALAMKLLDEACSKARELHEVSDHSRFPPPFPPNMRKVTPGQG